MTDAVTNVNKKICYFLSFLNIIDAISTMTLVYCGWGYEVNPFMDLLLQKSFVLFFSCKFVLSCAIILVGNKWSKHVSSGLPKFLLWFVTSAYCFVMFAHLKVIFEGFLNV